MNASQHAAHADLDFVSPDYMGMLDAEEGLPCNPTEYFSKLTDIELYLCGYQDAVARWADSVQRFNDAITNERHRVFCVSMSDRYSLDIN